MGAYCPLFIFFSLVSRPHPCYAGMSLEGWHRSTCGVQVLGEIGTSVGKAAAQVAMYGTEANGDKMRFGHEKLD